MGLSWAAAAAAAGYRCSFGEEDGCDPVRVDVVRKEKTSNGVWDTSAFRGQKNKEAGNYPEMRVRKAKWFAEKQIMHVRKSWIREAGKWCVGCLDFSKSWKTLCTTDRKYKLDL